MLASINGTAVTGLSTGTGNLQSGIRIGANYLANVDFLAGSIAEVFIVNGASKTVRKSRAIWPTNGGWQVYCQTIIRTKQPSSMWQLLLHLLMLPVVAFQIFRKLRMVTILFVFTVTLAMAAGLKDAENRDLGGGSDR